DERQCQRAGGGGGGDDPVMASHGGLRSTIGGGAARGRTPSRCYICAVSSRVDGPGVATARAATVRRRQPIRNSVASDATAARIAAAAAADSGVIQLLLSVETAAAGDGVSGLGPGCSIGADPTAMPPPVPPPLLTAPTFGRAT